jgi:hypothetical protein
MKVQDLIELINNNVELYHNADAEDLLYKHNVKKIAYNLGIDRHRWYETSIDVYKCEDGYVGITGISKIYFERMSSIDCGVHCYAEEYEPVQITSYKPKTSV